jgi:RND family efflux transporter MFP subunit
MNRLKARFMKASAAIALSMVLCSCARKDQSEDQRALPTVEVVKAIEANVPAYAIFEGTTSATETVDVLPRVTGIITKVAFEAGAEVKKDQVLFEIDSRQYAIDVDKAKAELARAEVRQSNTARDYERALKAGIGVSAQERDKAEADKAEAESAVKSARSTMQRLDLDLKYCNVTAPIAGRVGRALVTEGNLATRYETKLTRIVAEDKMYVDFDVDENTYLKYQRDVREGKIKTHGDKAGEVLMALSSDTGFPRKGIIDFIEPELNRRTGTIRVRGIFDNTDRSITAQAFARLKILAEPEKAILIPEKAVGTEQRRKFVFVVDDDGKARRRYVELGALQPDGWQVVEKGVQAGERVIVEGLLLVRDGMNVRTTGSQEQP